MRYIVLLFALTSLLCGAIIHSALAQKSKEAPQIDIRQFMGSGEFKAAGLDKLSARELEALNQWLGKFMVRTFQTSQGSSSGCSSVVESQIEGNFEGWSGETTFKLSNGQIWQQSSYSYTYHYAYRPEVTIFLSGGGCKMKVHGVSESLPVRRLK